MQLYRINTASLLTASITTAIDPLRDLALNACRMHQIEPDLVFADRCATACELNTQMAHQAHDLSQPMAESAQRFWASSLAQPSGLTADNLTAGLHSSGFQHMPFNTAMRASTMAPSHWPGINGPANSRQK